MLRSTPLKTSLLGLILLTIVGSFLLRPCTVSACSCMAPEPPQQELAASDAVFAGEVVSIQGSGPQFAFTSQFPFFGFFTSSADFVTVNFEVSEVWKGTIHQTVTIRTSGSSASCGFEFQTGNSYLVYAGAVDTELHTSLCSRTALLANAQEDLAAFGAGEQPLEGGPAVQGAPAGAALWWLAGGIAAATLGTVFVARRRRKQIEQ
ncbi:MAG: hypothetical protein MI924_16495 [Chloroflexales bacterium]|nr:hypothetical protein [Chloroflexales bacterium]